MSYPSTYTAYRRSAGKATKEKRLFLEQTQESLPKASDLNPNDVVIKIHAVSLNYREHAMLIGTYPMPLEEQGVPCSDAAAEVVGTGSAVKSFKVGDAVSPICGQGDFDPTDDGIHVGIGVNAPGVLRQYAVYQDKHLVRLPKNLSWEESSTLACAGVTAWNALDGLKTVQKHSSALLQGKTRPFPSILITDLQFV
jgi:NADPH:quinone reductase-like Zn-dependent oxidoreductase